LAGQEELLRNDAARQQKLAGVAASLEAFRARVQRGLAEASFEQRRQLVLLLVDRVIVKDAGFEIRYVLPTAPEREHVRFCHLRKDYFWHPPLAFPSGCAGRNLSASSAHGIERHDGALEMQGVEQLGNGGDLVRLTIDLALAERQPAPAPLRWYSSRCATGTLTSSAQALTRGSGPCSWRRLPERRRVLPSIATTARSTPAASDCAHFAKQASNASGSINMKTRRNVSCEGMPFGRAKTGFSQACLLHP
jgi:site-specific DNA recombinase